TGGCGNLGYSPPLLSPWRNAQKRQAHRRNPTRYCYCYCLLLMKRSLAITNRRQFLQGSALALASAALGGANVPRAFGGDLFAGRLWVNKPMRWAQLTLVEDDPGKFNPKFWLDYFKRTRSDAVCLSAGGCVAYYPTQVPLHHRSAWLGER